MIDLANKTMWSFLLIISIITLNKKLLNAWLKATMPYTVPFTGDSTQLADLYNAIIKTKAHKLSLIHI